jgi:hypothetical protein
VAKTVELIPSDLLGFGFEQSEDTRRSLPLLEGVRCYAIAATVEKTGGPADGLAGDVLLEPTSVCGENHRRPDVRSWAGLR